jgi:hypothetical protein
MIYKDLLFIEVSGDKGRQRRFVLAVHSRSGKVAIEEIVPVKPEFDTTTAVEAAEEKETEDVG